MKRKALSVLTILSVCFLFFGCAQAGVSSTGIAVKGTWYLASSYGSDYDETWEISDSSISYYSGSTLQWTGTIESYNNSAFNASESGEGSHGYATICYTYALNTGWGASGKYNIFRWENYTGSSCDFTVGYYDAGGDGANDVAESASVAESDITYASGYLTYYSEGASLQ